MALLFNAFIKHTDGSTTEYMNVEEGQMVKLFALVNWEVAQEFRLAKVTPFRGSETTSKGEAR